MSQVVTSLVVRIFCGSVICMVAILLAGDSPSKEPVRLCCACIMVLLIFSSLKGTKIGSFLMEESRRSVQEYVDRAIADANTYKQQTIAETAAEHVKSRARQLGITGEIQVNCQFSLDDMTVEKVVLNLSESVNQQLKNNLCEQLAIDLGVKTEQIIVSCP